MTDFTLLHTPSTGSVPVHRLDVCEIEREATRTGNALALAALATVEDLRDWEEEAERQGELAATYQERLEIVTDMATEALHTLGSDLADILVLLPDGSDAYMELAALVERVSKDISAVYKAVEGH